jgi:hypothetical protein
MTRENRCHCEERKRQGNGMGAIQGEYSVSKPWIASPASPGTPARHDGGVRAAAVEATCEREGSGPEGRGSEPQSGMISEDDESLMRRPIDRRPHSGIYLGHRVRGSTTAPDLSKEARVKKPEYSGPFRNPARPRTARVARLSHVRRRRTRDLLTGPVRLSHGQDQHHKDPLSGTGRFSHVPGPEDRKGSAASATVRCLFLQKKAGRGPLRGRPFSLVQVPGPNP